MAIQCIWCKINPHWRSPYCLGGSQATESSSWYFVSAIDVLAPPTSSTLVAFGDSITDGAASTPNANARWPSMLARKLTVEQPRQQFAVVDAEISGNRLLHDIIGKNALSRFERDALNESGADGVIMLEGINDIGFPEFKGQPYGNQTVTAEMMINTYEQLIARAHSRGIRVYGGTLTPFQGCFYYSDEGEQTREAIKEWIRKSGAFDGLINFDAALRDPQNPKLMAAQYDSGEHILPKMPAMEPWQTP
jgi:lysophospholipase L1-like esterase